MMHSSGDGIQKTAQPPTTFEEVVLPLLADTYQTAGRFARRREEARDLAQDAVVRALKGFARFAPGTNARAWLRTIVRSAFLTNCRRRERQVPLVDQDVECAGEWLGASTLAAPDAVVPPGAAGIA